MEAVIVLACSVQDAWKLCISSTVPRDCGVQQSAQFARYSVHCNANGSNGRKSNAQDLMSCSSQACILGSLHYHKREKNHSQITEKDARSLAPKRLGTWPYTSVFMPRIASSKSRLLTFILCAVERRRHEASEAEAEEKAKDLLYVSAAPPGCRKGCRRRTSA